MAVLSLQQVFSVVALEHCDDATKKTADIQCLTFWRQTWSVHRKEEKEVFVWCWCVRGRQNVCVVVEHRQGGCCSSVLNTCNLPKALNIATKHSNRSPVKDICTKVLTSVQISKLPFIL